KDVRLYLTQLTGVKSGRFVNASLVPSPREVKAWYGPNDGPATKAEAGKFKIDLNSAINSPWNESARLTFIEGFIASNQYACTDHERIEEAFISRFKSLKKSWKVREDNEQQKEQRRKSHNNAARKNKDFQRRLETVSLFPSIRDHAEIIRALGPEGMSSDESEMEGGERIYRVKQKPWRNSEVRTFLRILDKLFDIWRQSGGSSGSRRGAWHRNRVDTTKQSISIAVKGLPQNAYDPRWLASLIHIERQMLWMGQNMNGVLQYSFTYPDEIHVYIARHSGNGPSSRAFSASGPSGATAPAAGPSGTAAAVGPSDPTAPAAPTAGSNGENQGAA
ncbi:hypothetical protein EIP86_010711, partial [Pleurotus ostreatoroseus]